MQSFVLSFQDPSHLPGYHSSCYCTTTPTIPSLSTKKWAKTFHYYFQSGLTSTFPWKIQDVSTGCKTKTILRLWIYPEQYVMHYRNQVNSIWSRFRFLKGLLTQNSTKKIPNVTVMLAIHSVQLWKTVSNL